MANCAKKSPFLVNENCDNTTVGVNFSQEDLFSEAVVHSCSLVYPFRNILQSTSDEKVYHLVKMQITSGIIKKHSIADVFM